MNKKILTAIIAIITLVPSTAYANLKNTTTQTPAIAILDTAIDTSLPIFKDKIAQEVCILEWNSCPNGKNFMEGKGAAVLPSNIISRNGFDHGTQMASIAITRNPNMKIVFIRIIGNTFSGDRQVSYEMTVINALDWVVKNASKYNIQAVSMSQGHSNYALAADYCPNTPFTKQKITDLAGMGIPTVLPAGNNRNYTKINWPACINESVSVGGVDRIGEIALYSNYDPARLDFYDVGNTTAFLPGNKITNVAGTSAAVQNFAASWVAIRTAKPSLTYQQVYDLIAKTSTPTKNARIPLGKLINQIGAING